MIYEAHARGLTQRHLEIPESLRGIYAALGHTVITVIYEAHARGLTQRHLEIPESLRGIYAALGHTVIVNYLHYLGVTALELLPVAHFASEPRLQRLGLSNY